MLKKFLCLLLLATPAYADNMIEDIPRDCDIKIQFGTFSTGLDSEIYERILGKINSTPAVIEKHLLDINIKGERTLCLMVKQEEQKTVYEDLKDIIPAESIVGWEKISLRSGESFQTTWPKKYTPKPRFN